MKRVKPETNTERSVLAWCNRKRKMLGRRSVKTLAKGLPRSCSGCVVAKTIGGVIVNRVDIRKNNPDESYVCRTPKYIWQFMDKFDLRKLPRLEE